MLTPEARLGLKGVTLKAIKAAGGQENCANISRIKRPATFSDYASVSHQEIIALDVAVDLDQFNGTPLLIAAAAGELGCLLYRMPEVAVAQSDEAGLLRAAKETTEAIASGWAARADGVATPAEDSAEIKEIEEAVIALLERRAFLVKRGAGSPDRLNGHREPLRASAARTEGEGQR